MELLASEPISEEKGYTKQHTTKKARLIPKRMGKSKTKLRGLSQQNGNL